MKVNKSGDMTPFDMKKKPCRQPLLLLPVIWAACFFLTRKYKLKINKSDMKGLKPPFLVISTHQGFSDYYIAPLSVFPHRASYISDMEGFAAFGDTLYRKIGCIGKRRFVTDISVLINIKHALYKNKDIVFVFPEARHCNCGTTSLIPNNIGRLCKYLDVPVAVLSVHGSYLASPLWDEEHSRKTRMEAKIKLLYTKEALEKADESEIQRELEKSLAYDEYEWQKENNIKITYKNRAEGLHQVLYKCKSCEKEYSIESSGSLIYCTKCGNKWEMSELGELIDLKNGEKTHIPDWYEWERLASDKKLEGADYHRSFSVKVEALPNEKGFVSMGSGTLTHDIGGFTLDIGGKRLSFPSEIYETVQTEYNYKGKGKCLVLSNKDCCYYAYCDSAEFNPTELQFAAEKAHRLKAREKAETKASNNIDFNT